MLDIDALNASTASPFFSLEGKSAQSKDNARRRGVNPAGKNEKYRSVLIF